MAETAKKTEASVKPAAAEKAEQERAKRENQADPTKADGNKDGDTFQVGTGEGQLSPAKAGDANHPDVKVDTSEAEEITKRSEKVYNIHAGLGRRVGGPFLDQLELEEAERRRAVIEGREPDFDNNAGSAGVPLVNAQQLALAHATTDHLALAKFIDDNSEDGTKGPVPMGEVNQLGNVTQEARDTAAAERKAFSEWDETTVTSHDNPDVRFTPGVESYEKVDKD